jgi:hypothetical protein
MREIRLSGSEGGGANSIVSPYPYRAVSEPFVTFVAFVAGSFSLRASPWLRGSVLTRASVTSAA